MICDLLLYTSWNYQSIIMRQASMATLMGKKDIFFVPLIQNAAYEEYKHCKINLIFITFI